MRAIVAKKSLLFASESGHFSYEIFRPEFTRFGRKKLQLASNSVFSSSSRAGLFHSISEKSPQTPERGTKATRKPKPKPAPPARPSTLAMKKNVRLAKPGKPERSFSNETIDYITKKFNSSVSMRTKNEEDAPAAVSENDRNVGNRTKGDRENCDALVLDSICWIH